MPYLLLLFLSRNYVFVKKSFNVHSEKLGKICAMCVHRHTHPYTHIHTLIYIILYNIQFNILKLSVMAFYLRVRLHQHFPLHHRQCFVCSGYTRTTFCINKFCSNGAQLPLFTSSSLLSLGNISVYMSL